MGISYEDVIVEELRQLIGGGWAGPTSDEAVSEAEHRLGLLLPNSYRLFLRHFGAACVGPFEIHGLCKSQEDSDIPFFGNVVDQTLSDRRGPVPKAHPNLPVHLVVIAGDEGGTFYLDTSAMDEHRECPVVVRDCDVTDALVAANFLDFLRKLGASDELLWQGKRL